MTRCGCSFALVLLAGSVIINETAAGAAAAITTPSRIQLSSSHTRSILQDTIRNRNDNSHRAQLAMQNAILLAVRSGAQMDSTAATGADGIALAKLAASASAQPSDFEPGAGRRLLQGRQLVQLGGISGSVSNMWSAASTYDGIQKAAAGGARLSDVSAAASHGSTVARLVSSRAKDPSDFDP